MSMYSLSKHTRRLLLPALLATSAVGLLAQAQNNANRTGGFGGFQAMGGAGGTGTTSSSSASTRSYTNATLVGDAMITSDVETRQIVVVADEETNEKIRQIIESMDKPKSQVLINVVFLQITHSKDLDVGLSGVWNDAAINGHSSATGTATTAFGAPSTGAFYKIVNNDLTATFHALAELGKTEILSRPSILARSSQQATIMVGQEVPFITNSRITDEGQTINTVTYEDIGIILRVTPFITKEGLVEMMISPEISSVSDQTVAISSTVNTPLIDKRSADTVVVTPSDKTIVIGGLIGTQSTRSEFKIPLLGDIPWIGAAFKRKTKTDTKTELMIFLTPHVVDKPEDLAKLTEAEQKKLELKPDTFKKEDIKKLSE